MKFELTRAYFRRRYIVIREGGFTRQASEGNCQSSTPTSTFEVLSGISRCKLLFSYPRTWDSIWNKVVDIFPLGFDGVSQIISVLLLTLDDEEMAFAAAEKMSLHRIRDSMGDGLEPVLGYLKCVDSQHCTSKSNAMYSRTSSRLVGRILANVDPELSETVDLYVAGIISFHVETCGIQGAIAIPMSLIPFACTFSCVQSCGPALLHPLVGIDFDEP